MSFKHAPPEPCDSLYRVKYPRSLNYQFRCTAAAIFLVLLVRKSSVGLCCPTGVGATGRNVTACRHHESEGGTATVDDGGKAE